MTGISLDRFRDVFSAVASPVSVVSTSDGDRILGTTVSSFCSLSADPPMVLVALADESNTLEAVLRTRAFAVSILAHDQAEAAMLCASKDPSKAGAISWARGEGQPRLEGAASWLSCRLENAFPGGDHTILAGLIVDCGVTDATPLVYHRRSFCVPGGPAADGAGTATSVRS